MGRRSAENVRALSFARTMHHEATESGSVTVHVRRRECKESSAPGEGPEEALSDAGSIPAGSTNQVLGEHLFLQRRFRRKGVALIPLQKCHLGVIQGGIFVFPHIRLLKPRLL